MTDLTLDVRERVDEREPLRTPEDQVVWRRALEGIKPFAGRSAISPKTYRDGIDFYASLDAVPSLAQINAWLGPTGWRCVFVDAFVPLRFYQQLHALRIFPVARRLRRLDELEYSPAPDFFHDVVGHLSMLFDRRYRHVLELWALRTADAEASPEDLAAGEAYRALLDVREAATSTQADIDLQMQRLSAAHAKAAAAPSRFALFETFYAWVFEFGMVRSDEGRTQVIGAAALSSAGELGRIQSGVTRRLPFASQAIGHTVNYARYQPDIFVAESYDEYEACLNNI